MKLFQNDKFKFKTNRRLFIALILVIAAVITGALVLRGKSAQASGDVPEQRTAAAVKGTLNVTLSGSGSVSPAQKTSLTVAVNGKIEESFLEEGKAVKAGDILLKLNDTDALLAVKKLENTVNQKRLSSVNQSLKDGALAVTTPITGRVAEISVHAGDTVNKGMNLLTLVDESSLQTSVTFENTTTEQFSNVETVQLQIPDFMTTITGRIKSLVQDGFNVHAVVLVNNPGELKSGALTWVEAQTKDGTLVSTKGTFEVQNKVQIKAEASGTVSDLSAGIGQVVGSGKLLMTISSDGLAYELEGQQLDLEQSRLELEQARENLENYIVKAPFDGIITSVTDLQKGDSIKAGSSVGVILNSSVMTFQVNIDELDISQVQTGQKAFVTAEALQETSSPPIEGEVTAIAFEGASSNGVTSYPVTISIPGQEKLKSGMNVDAVIQILSKGNALLVPIEAVQKQGSGYIVWVKGDKTPSGSDVPQENNTQGSNQGSDRQMGRRFTQGAQASGTENAQQWARNAQNRSAGYYNGAVPVRVTVGQHNETWMEITEGLNEGDVVVLPALVSNSSSSSSQGTGAPGFMPIGGGGFTRQAIPNMRRDNND